MFSSLKIRNFVTQSDSLIYDILTSNVIWEVKIHKREVLLHRLIIKCPDKTGRINRWVLLSDVTVHVKWMPFYLHMRLQSDFAHQIHLTQFAPVQNPVHFNGHISRHRFHCQHRYLFAFEVRFQQIRSRLQALFVVFLRFIRINGINRGRIPLRIQKSVSDPLHL